MAIKKILISQASPKVTSVYENLTQKYGVSFDFKPFYKIVPVTSMELRSQRCNPLDYSAIVFSSRSTIDAFFSLCEELRFKIPETMKYFCTNEKVAMYLQKHIVYRKRKIFFGEGSPASVLDLITAKHKDENFLIVTADTPESSLTKAFDGTPFKHSSAFFAKSVSCDLKDELDINQYDMMVMYNKHDVSSIQANFPDFKQGETALITYGSESLKKAALEAGLTITASVPSEQFASVTAAIEFYLSK